ncbi:MAG: AsmA family protein [Alphaproteobacteria bacterium]|nr:AsmA family protein [Alphaproteobacteria bacterium]
MPKKIVKIFASIVFSLIIILAIGGYFAVRHFDLNKYKSYVEDIAEQQLGRILRINGDAKVALSLVPTIVVNDVELANASWAQNAQMIKVSQAEVKFALLPLLKKQIIIDKVILDAPEIYLEKSSSGEVNWNFGDGLAATKSRVSVPQSIKQIPDVAKAPVTVLAASFAAKNVQIEKGIVEYYDAKTNQLQRLQINEIDLKIPDANSPIQMTFDLLYNQDEVQGTIDAGSLAQVLNKDGAFPFVMSLKALGVEADINGTIANLLENPQYAMLVNFYNPAGNLGAPETTLKTRLDGDMRGLTANIETLNVVNNLITGKVKVRWDGIVPQVSADLQSPKIDVGKFNTKNNFAFMMPSIIGEAQALESVPNEPIPYELLYKADANVKLNVGKVILAQGLSANNMSLEAVLKSGKLSVNPLLFDFGGGSLEAKINVDAANKSMAVKAISKNMLIQNLYGEFAVTGDNDFGVKSGGQTDIDINLRGKGDTYRQVVDNLDGQVIVIVGNSVVQTGALQFMRTNFIRQLLDVFGIVKDKVKNVDLTCAVLRADFNNGKVNMPQGIAIDSKQLTVMADGNVNLHNEDILFTVEPSLHELSTGNLGQALASFVKITGTIQKPKIRIDDKEALKTVVGVLATGGVSYMGSQMLLNGSGEPCYTALQGTPYASRFPKPTGVRATGQEVYKDTTNQIKKELKNLENAAKDLLGVFTSTNKK